MVDCFTSFHPVKFNCPNLFGLLFSKKMGEIMDRIMTMFTDFIGQVTTLVVSLVALGVAAGVVFGDVPFVGGVLDNLLDLVNRLGENGLVGLLVLALLMSMYNR